MTFKKITFFIFLLATTFSVVGQQTKGSRIKVIKKENKKTAGQVYITCKIDSNNNTINVFLVNRSDSTINFYGFGDYIEFEKQAKDKNGKWKRIKKFKTCGTGYGYYPISSNHFTWESIIMNNPKGNFTTELRFVLHVGDTLITSKPIKASIDYHDFYPTINFMLYNIEQELLNPNLNDSAILKLRKEEVQYLLCMEGVEVGAVKLKTLIEEYPDFLDGKYLYVKVLLFNIIPKVDAKVERIMIVSKAIQIIEGIESTSKKYQETKKLIDGYRSSLPTKKEWEEILNVECTRTNGVYECYSAVLHEKVSIHFKK